MSKTITYSINAELWTLHVISEIAYGKRFKADKDSEAICLIDKKEIWFRKSGCTPAIIAHELMHVLIDQSNHKRSNLTAEDVEELVCEVVGRHYAAIPYMIAEIYRLLT